MIFYLFCALAKLSNTLVEHHKKLTKFQRMLVKHGGTSMEHQ
jgi:hypothetical protein